LDFATAGKGFAEIANEVPLLNFLSRIEKKWVEGFLVFYTERKASISFKLIISIDYSNLDLGKADF